MKKSRWICLCLCMMFLLSGCQGLRSSDTQEGQDPDEALNQEQDTWERIDLEALENMLMEAAAIELKDTDNQGVGMLSDREAIRLFIEELFSYPLQERYPQDRESNQVIGPINFYIDGTDDIYGLVKEEYIYIEGYYFLLDTTKAKALEELFGRNTTIAAPNGN